MNTMLITKSSHKQSPSLMSQSKTRRIKRQNATTNVRLHSECIYKIATRLSTRPNFINYTYRDEMICDAIENCIQYIGNFNRRKI